MKATLMKATLNEEQLNLLGLVVPHFGAVGSDEAKFYLRNENRSQIPEALKRGFVLPSAIVLSATPVALGGYAIEETDCLLWLGHMEQFVEKHLGAEVNLRELFNLPARLPWKKVLPIFDPGLTDRKMIDKALKARGVDVYESTDVMKFSGASASPHARLTIIERSLTPTSAGMGLPPKFHKHWFAGRQTKPLHRRGYGIATSLLHEVEKQFLDPETFTWFSENVLPGGEVAYGRWSGSWVRFGWDGPDRERVRGGFREAIEVPLKPKTLIP